jgi:hypothetical protein
MQFEKELIHVIVVLYRHVLTDLDQTWFGGPTHHLTTHFVLVWAHHISGSE